MSERKRESNFTNSEIDLPLHLCNTNKNILENKTTNAVTWKQNILAWEKIYTEFNSTTDGPVSIVYNVTKVWLVKVSNKMYKLKCCKSSIKIVYQYISSITVFNNFFN